MEEKEKFQAAQKKNRTVIVVTRHKRESSVKQ